jgi:hypothetical protein
MVEFSDIDETMIYELIITVSSQFIIYNGFARYRMSPPTDTPDIEKSSIVVSPASNETLTASGFFMKTNKREASDKITELRNSGNCPIPENFNIYYGIRHDDEDCATPYTVESLVPVNIFGTIIMDDGFSQWLIANTNAADKFAVIEKMWLIDPTTKETAFYMEKF